MITWDVFVDFMRCTCHYLYYIKEEKVMTDIEIAQSVKPRHILEIAREAGVDEKYIELH